MNRWMSLKLCGLDACTVKQRFHPQKTGKSPRNMSHIGCATSVAWDPTLAFWKRYLAPAVPVVPHKAVAEVSKLETYRRDGLLWITNGRANPPLSLSLFFHLSINQSVYLSICLSVCLSVYPSICLSIYLSVCLSICLPVYLSICLSICLSVYLSICGAVSFSVV